MTNRGVLVWVQRLPVFVGRRRTTVYDRNRFSDWYMAFVKFAVAAWLLQMNREITIGSEGSWASSLSSKQWAMILIALGLLRIAAVLINGHWRNGGSAIIRGVAAFIGAVFWSQIIYYSLRLNTGAFNFGMIVFASWLALDIASAARAAWDYQRIRVARRRAASDGEL